jgi:hypothetical protein
MLDPHGHKTIELNQDHGNITLGGNGQDGDLSLLNNLGRLTIHMNGQRGSVILGGEREDGDLTLRNSENVSAIHLSGNSGDGYFGGHGVNGNVSVYKSDGTKTIHLVGSTGRIEVNGETLNVPDYVFQQRYPLEDLRSVKSFIDEHKHLPGIPSQDEIKQDGIELVSFSLDLLKKVEELTLHLIRQQEEIGQLRDTVVQMRKSEDRAE